MTKYQWSDGITETQKFTLSKPGNYAVTVTDDKNCSSSDTIHVHLIIHDLAMSRLDSPENSCTQTSNTAIKVTIRNTGTDTIQVSEPLILSYEVNGLPVQKDTIYAATIFKPNDSIHHTFSKGLDMATPGSYNFKLKSFVENDIQPLNDSLLQW
ncbi:MAG: hypothetical protein HC830_11175 [Bacteroidetes bacterium]|nr:hypothetical protein [Bacteroidota bacterium]